MKIIITVATGLLLALLLLLAACSGRPVDSGTPGIPATITGTVTYRERMALAPDDTIRVVLEDVSLADTVAPTLAEQMISGAGKQVPVPFSLTYDTGWTAYVSDWTGGALTITWVIVAYLFWRKRDSLPQTQSQAQSQASLAAISV